MERMTNRPIIENGMKYFKCKKCGEVKPLNKSYFYVNMNTRLGFISKCISCIRKEIENKPKVKYITRAELEGENKKLKEERKQDIQDINSRYKEAEKLKSDLAFERTMLDNVRAEYESLQNANKELKEKVETLELWLDNKEKLNEEYRKEIDLLKCQTLGPSELADSLYDANKTIEKLKAELSKYKKQYQHSMGFMEEDTLQELKDIGELEDDELIYEEGLYD